MKGSRTDIVYFILGLYGHRDPWAMVGFQCVHRAQDHWVSPGVQFRFWHRGFKVGYRISLFKIMFCKFSALMTRGSLVRSFISKVQNFLLRWGWMPKS